MEQQCWQLVRQPREEVGDGMRVEPQPGRGNQPEPLNLPRSHCRHLGSDHAAH